MRALLAALLLAAGCSAWPEDPMLHGAYFENRSAVLRTTSEMKAELRSAIELGALYWGVSPRVLEGWRIVMKDDSFLCAGHWARGCTDFTNQTITISSWRNIHSEWPTTLDCMEHSTLLHEIGHVVEIDLWHWGAAWWDHARLARYWATAFVGNPRCVASYGDDWRPGGSPRQ